MVRESFSPQNPAFPL